MAVINNRIHHMLLEKKNRIDTHRHSLGHCYINRGDQRLEQPLISRACNEGFEL
jgi:hypothetical protein